MGSASATTPETLTAHNNATVHLRAVKEDDAGLIIELFEASSAETVFNRFLAPVARLDDERIRTLTHLESGIDYAIAACIDENGRERIAGVGRFRRISREAAEIAIVVGDPWQRLGIGGMLLRQLTTAAREMNLEWFDSTIDPGNLRLLRFAEACGFKGSLKYQTGLLHMRTDISSLFPEEPHDPIAGHPRP